jgi:hypothetical protein
VLRFHKSSKKRYRGFQVKNSTTYTAATTAGEGIIGSKIDMTVKSDDIEFSHCKFKKKSVTLACLATHQVEALRTNKCVLSDMNENKLKELEVQQKQSFKNITSKKSKNSKNSTTSYGCIRCVWL